MEKTIAERRLEILDWEENNRSLKNRGVSQETGCAYYVEGTPGCAIGRLLEPELAKRLSGGVDVTFNRLPTEIQELGLEFLNSLQHFHDHWPCFTNEGLSEFGKAAIADLKEQYTKE